MSSVMQEVLAWSGGIITVGGAIAVIVKWLAPAFRLTARVNEIERKQLNDYGTINDIRCMQSLLCKGVMTLIDHELTGNSVEKLKGARQAMQDYLIDGQKK